MGIDIAEDFKIKNERATDATEISDRIKSLHDNLLSAKILADAVTDDVKVQIDPILTKIERGETLAPVEKKTLNKMAEKYEGIVFFIANASTTNMVREIKEKKRQLRKEAEKWIHEQKEQPVAPAFSLLRETGEKIKERLQAISFGPVPGKAFAGATGEDDNPLLKFHLESIQKLETVLHNKEDSPEYWICRSKTKDSKGYLYYIQFPPNVSARYVRLTFTPTESLSLRTTDGQTSDKVSGQPVDRKVIEQARGNFAYLGGEKEYRLLESVTLMAEGKKRECFGK